MKYMLLMMVPYGTGDWSLADWKPDEVKAMTTFMNDFNKALSAAGELVAAEGLESPRDARIVRAGDTGEPLVTDGPFAETKEFLAGYWIVDVPTEARAHAIAARASMAPGPGGQPLRIPIEVRRVGQAPA